MRYFLPFLLMFSMLTGNSINAQKNSTLQWGISATGFVYQGDLTPHQSGAWNTAKYGMGIWAGKYINPFVSVRLQFLSGQLHADDATYHFPTWMQHRRFLFHTRIQELSTLFVAEPGTAGKKISPYLLAGVSLATVRIKRDYSGLDAEFFTAGDPAVAGLPADIDHRMPRLIAGIPAGAGIRYQLTQHIAVHAETMYRWIFTDYLDGFSQAANPSRKDHYQTYSVGFSFKRNTGNRLNCPPSLL